MAEPHLVNNCPILERTGDDRPVGRCFFYLKDGVCQRHGDVSIYQERYKETGKLIDERELIIRRQMGEALKDFPGELPETVTLRNPWPGIVKAVVNTRTGDARLQMEQTLDFIKFTVEV